MQATIWARDFAMPTGFCYNCNAPPTELVTVQSEGGIASGVGISHGLLVAAVAAAARRGPAHDIPYCELCARAAHKKAPERFPPTLGLVLLAAGFTAIAALTEGDARLVGIIGALAAAGGLVAWIRYLRRPAEPGQTTRWRAFAVLNQGKDIFKRNREFVRIEYSNPRVLQEIVGLNPGIEVTA